jgi:hypothetical protein
VSTSPSESLFARIPRLANIRGELIPAPDFLRGNAGLSAEPPRHFQVCGSSADHGVQFIWRDAEVGKEYAVDPMGAAKGDLIFDKQNS